MLEVEFAHLSDCGRVRDHNEDFVGYLEPETADHARTHGWLFALADGVGGHDYGEVAARVAVETVLKGFRAAAGHEPHTALLPRLVQEANLRVYETGRAAKPGGAAMATTLVACALRFDRAAVAHVGDSRCYRVRRGHALALTQDHTVVNDQVRLGLLSKQGAAQAETRHVLSRSVGHDLFVSVETNEHQVVAGDVLVLCSDGLHGSVMASDIGHIVAAHGDLSTAARNLVDLANQRDGGDNISVQLIRVRDVERVGMYRGRPYQLR